MSRVPSISAVFVAVSVSSCAVHGREKPDSIAQHVAGNAELRPALRAPGMDTRAGELCVVDIPWGVALRAPVQGPMKHRTCWQWEV